MPDMGKVIDHLNECMELSSWRSTWTFVRKDIIKDALELLKEQEAVKPTYRLATISDSVHEWICGSCEWPLWMVFLDDHKMDARKIIHYCPSCGKAVKWDE